MCKFTVLAFLLAGAACGGDDNTAVRLTSITPDHGPQIGGNIVTIKGSGFATAGSDFSRFLVGDELALDIQIVSNVEARLTMPPASSAGLVNLEVFNGNGANTISEAYSYNPQPTVTASTPGDGPMVGGTEVTLTGTGFLDLEAGDNTVDFDGIPAAVLSVVSDTEMKVESPPGVPPKLRDIKVANSNGAGVLVTAFDYIGNGNSLLAYSHGRHPGYGGGSAPDPKAGQVLLADLSTLTVETTIGAPGGEVGGIATVADNGDTIYLRTLNRVIYSMDPKTGVRTEIGPMPAESCRQSLLTDMEFHQGILYGFCRRNQFTPHFGRINPTTFEFTPIGPAPTNNNSESRNNLASDGTTLYIVGRSSERNINRIATIDPATGAEGTTFEIGLGSIRGATFLNGKLYVLNQNFAGGGSSNRQANLHELNPGTGVATHVMPLGANLHGLSVAP